MSQMPESSAYERGRHDEKIAEHDRRLDAINGSIDRAEESLAALRKDVHSVALNVTGMGAKIGVYAGLAAFVASAIGSVVTGVTIYQLIH